jgi:hypothetical protein
MKKFYIDFSGYCTIKAENEEKAEQEMWEAIQKAFDGEIVYDDVWDIDGIEERRD